MHFILLWGIFCVLFLTERQDRTKGEGKINENMMTRKSETEKKWKHLRDIAFMVARIMTWEVYILLYFKGKNVSRSCQKPFYLLCAGVMVMLLQHTSRFSLYTSCNVTFFFFQYFSQRMNFFRVEWCCCLPSYHVWHHLGVMHINYSNIWL